MGIAQIFFCVPLLTRCCYDAKKLFENFYFYCCYYYFCSFWCYLLSPPLISSYLCYVVCHIHFSLISSPLVSSHLCSHILCYSCYHPFVQGSCLLFTSLLLSPLLFLLHLSHFLLYDLSSILMILCVVLAL